MKKKWLGLLSLLCCGSMALGLSACSEEGTKKEEWGTVYSFETAYAQAQELGYADTLDKFIEQISGAKGEKGDIGIGVKKVEVNGEGNLVVTLTNDTQIDCGKIAGKDGVDGKDGVGISSVQIVNGELIILLTDTSVLNLGKVVGADGKDGTNGTNGTNGKDGVGISSMEVNPDGTATVYFTDGTNKNIGKIVGEKGDSGVGVKKVEVNGEGNLIISLTNDTQINCGKVAGKDGVDGKDGVGISSVYFNDKNELVVVYTDETEKVVGTIPACDHIYGEWTVGEQATCISMGYQYRTCTVCENVEYDFTEKLGHTFGDWQELIDTCTEHWQTRTCQICGNSHSQAVPAKGHLFFNGKCTECGEIDIQNVDLSAFDKYNGTYGYEFLGTMENGEGLQALYKTIDDKVKRFHANTSLDLSADGVLAEIELSPYGLESDKAVSVWKTYKSDNPLYYWLSNAIPYTNDTIILLVEKDYLNGNVREYYNQLIEDKVNEYASLWYNGASAYDIALAYHDAILTAIDYSYDQNNKPEDSAWAHNIVGVFNEQGAVCEGYARSFQLLLNYAGVENVFVTGESRRESHAWNLVQLDDGNWYWCDLTWDDTPNQKWGISYNYFLINDTHASNFLQSHTYDTAANSGVNFLYDLPARNSQAYTPEDIALLDEISVNNMILQVVGYRTLELHTVIGNGDFKIPETVEYQGKNYKIISLGAQDTYQSISSQGEITSFTIPKSVVFIWDCTFRDSNIENIYVAEDNPKFISKKGVLFTKSLRTLIQYPSANTRTEYIIPDETKELAHLSFDNCKYLEELTLGKNISTIGIASWGIIESELYRICNALTGKQQINVAEDNAFYATYNGAIYNKDLSYIYVFSQPKNITTVTISANVIGIDSYAQTADREKLYIFDSLENLESIFVEEGNEYYTIQDGVLYNKEKTELIHAPKKISGDIVVPDSVISMGIDAFLDRINLTSVTIGNGVTSIGSHAFSGCSSLNNVIIGNSVTSISYHAFYNCSSLTNVIIGNSVTSIGSYAFYNCSSLESLSIPTGVTSIGSDAFDGCEKLIQKEYGVSYVDKWVIDCDTSVTVATLREGTKGIADYAFSSCNSLTSITILDGVTSIGNYAFSRCSSLTSITIPDGVTSIGNYAFYGCDSLTSIIIPDGVTSIGYSTFSDCSSLTSITIPDSVTSIAQWAFSDCSSLTDVYYLGTESDWNNISIDSSNSYLTDATRYYYSETEPTEEGNFWRYVDGVATPW